MASVVKLSRRWELGDQLGRGGFGRVFEATDDDGDHGVAKLIPKVPGAQRELLFEDLRGARNVVPILDSGEWDDHWVIVMPRAEHSLRHRLSVVAGGVLPPDEAVSVLRDVADALVDIAARVVHRDIKPENTLYLLGHWCLADFGIARYAEASTAPDTHKFALTPPYAAPERWRAEHATAACDIYAFGVMAFEILAGSLPFAGPTVEDFRQQHLNEQPPSLASAPPSLASLVTECLYKAPEARPTAANVATRLASVLRPAVGAVGRLQEANRLAVEQAGAAAARASSARSNSERRATLVADATQSLQALSATLRATVLEAAPSARPGAGSRSLAWELTLNGAVLEFGRLEPTPANPWGPWKPAFEVVAQCAVGVRIPRDRYGYEGRSHSLWYCDAQAPNAFRWFETAFMISPLLPRRGLRDPFALIPGEEAGEALSPGIGSFQGRMAVHAGRPGGRGGLSRTLDRLVRASSPRRVEPSAWHARTAPRRQLAAIGPLRNAPTPLPFAVIKSTRRIWELSNSSPMHGRRHLVDRIWDPRRMAGRSPNSSPDAPKPLCSRA